MSRVIHILLVVAAALWCQPAVRASIPASDDEASSQERSSDESGAIDPRTGRYYPAVPGGVVDPETGTFYPRIREGYVDPGSGEVLPER
ncbi:MAG: hypothetical protein ACREVJ_01200 [Gammaproteobacteria bacterium]